MAYTTVDSVAQLFPNFTRNSSKGPSDTIIQGLIDAEAAKINAMLQRRFSEAIAAFPGASPAAQFAAYIASFASGSDQLNLLANTNAFAAAGELASIFETFGIQSYAKLAAQWEEKAEEIYRELESDGKDAKQKNGGRFDKLFDPLSRSVSPRPEFFGAAGGDQPRSKDEDVTDYFKKWPGTRSD